MAFLIFFQKGKEIGRWQLSGPTVIGRATDCQVSVHDILLSRHHCRVQPVTGGSWEVIDLNSKNGTQIGDKPIKSRGLRDGDVLTMGRTVAHFQIGRLKANSPGVERMKKQRPADPKAAVAGTVFGFEAQVVADVAAVAEVQRKRRFPRPQPAPPEPAVYAREDLYTMLTEIASSSWDSIYANASRPRRPLPAPPPLAPGVTSLPAATPIKRPTRPGDAWTLEARLPVATRPKRPTRSTQFAANSTGPRRWVSRLAWSIVYPVQKVRGWVAPIGAIRLV